MTKYNNNPLNLKDGDIYLDPITGKTCVILNGDKVELLDDTQINNSSCIQAPVRVQSVYMDQASLHMTIMYTDGTKEAYNILSFPEVKNVRVGMTKYQVATILSAADISSHITNGDFVDTGVSVASAGASQAVGAQSPYARTGSGLGKAMANSVYGASGDDWLSKRWSDPSYNSWDINSIMPWADLGVASRNDDKIVCSDLPDLKLKPYEGFDPSTATVQVYYQDRFPSKRTNVLIDDAIEALKKYKGMNVRIISKNLFQDGWNITYGITKNYGPDVKQGILMEVILPQRIFDRTHHTIDNYAGLRGKWDTDTYITLRIAYVLGHATKLNESDARGYKSDILKIVNKTTRPIFTF